MQAQQVTALLGQEVPGEIAALPSKNHVLCIDHHGQNQARKTGSRIVQAASEVRQIIRRLDACQGTLDQGPLAAQDIEVLLDEMPFDGMGNQIAQGQQNQRRRQREEESQSLRDRGASRPVGKFQWHAISSIT